MDDINAWENFINTILLIRSKLMLTNLHEIFMKNITEMSTTLLSQQYYKPNILTNQRYLN